MHDSENMTLWGHQRRMIDDAVASGAKVVLVLLTVNPQDLAFAAESPSIGAILHAYYPQHYAGQAIADVLLGVTSPAGRMPYTWPRDLSLAGNISNYTIAGTDKGYRYRTRAAAAANTLWSFGYGLSYTRFKYSSVTVTPATVAPCGNVTVAVRVTNAGATDSDEVVQVYASWRLASAVGVVSTPVRQLVGFERVFVPAGTTAEVTVVIAAAQMAVLNATGSFVPRPRPPGPPFNPCDGTVCGGKCGLLNHTDLNTPQSWSVPASSLAACCQSCQGAPKCVAFTLTWCRGNNCTCWMHASTDGYTPGRQGATSGVVFARAPKFPPCPPPPPPTPLPTWTVAPGTVHLSIGGQQPDQTIAAPSNVLTASFGIAGAPVALDACR